MLTRSVLSRVAGFFRRRHSDRECDEEFNDHLRLLRERFVRQGMTPEEAHYAAKRQFGGIVQMKETLRDRRSLPLLDGLLKDARYALRQLRKAPVFAVAAVATLALGIGANTAVFAVVNAVLLQPLPFPEPQRLVSVEDRDVRGTPHPETLSYPNFFDFRRDNTVFEHLACYRDDEFALSAGGQSIHVDGEIVSWDLFQLLGVRPELGRPFLPEEEKPGTHVVIISHELWQTQFGSDRGVVGHAVRVDGELTTIAGVAPKGFQFPSGHPQVALWTTLARDGDTTAGTHPLTSQRGARLVDAIARLKPGITLQRAQAQMNALAASLAAKYPDDDKNFPGTYVRRALERMTGDVRKPMFVLLGAVGLVLLIACANIANLLLARATERQREFAVRAAIGASRRTVIRQLLTESFVLAVAGCAAGIGLALISLHWMLPFAGQAIPRIGEAAIDPMVLGFSAAITVGTTLLFSLAPAIQIARTDLVASLKEASRGIAHGHHRLRRVLVAGQITLGLMLLSGAGLLIASFLHLTRRDPGFRPDHLLTFSFDLPASYKTTAQIAFSDRLVDGLKAIPGVEKAAFGFPLPLSGSQMTIGFDIEEHPMPPSQRPHADIAIVSPDYFAATRIPLLEGRLFTDRDNAKAPPVLVVNQAFAEKFFPGEDVVGKRITPGASSGGNPETLHEIVGVIGNAKQTALTPDAEPIYYFPYKQLAWSIGTVLLRTSVPPLTIERAARAVVGSLEKQAPVYQVRLMEDLAADAISGPRFQMLLFVSFASIALLLTVVGLYGVLAYSVTKRTREIGVRMALGASRVTVLRMVLREAMLLVAVGIALGLTGAIAGGRLLRNMLYGVSSTNPMLLGIACGTIIVASLIAAYIPASRAAQVEPSRALRSE